ncbi:MAG TPA: class I SAM-dependent methyltransferase [Thermoleophilaceae bacterium]|jgi:predicted O-methyltransferase YrrM
MRRVVAAARRAGLLVRLLPPRVAWFYFRARRTAARSGDDWSLKSATKPESLALLLKLARGRRAVVEIGTGTAWTTAALALADPRRNVVSYDPVMRPERDRYLAIAGPSATARIELIAAGGEAGPAPEGPAPDFVFVDGSHERELTISTFEAWRGALAPGGVIAFHDYGNELYPGVSEAIAELGIEGRVERDVFVWSGSLPSEG